MNQQTIDGLRERNMIPKTYSNEWVESQYKGSFCEAMVNHEIAMDNLKRVARDQIAIGLKLFGIGDGTWK